MVQNIIWRDNATPGKTFDGSTHPTYCTCDLCVPRPTKPQEPTMSTNEPIDATAQLIADLITDAAAIARTASPDEIAYIIEQCRLKGIEQPEWRPLLFPIMARLGAEQSLRDTLA